MSQSDKFCRAIPVEDGPGSPDLHRGVSTLHGCYATPESALPGPPLGGLCMRRDYAQDSHSATPPIGLTDARLESSLRRLAAVLLDIASNTAPPKTSNAVGYEPTAFEGGVDAGPHPPS